MKTLYLLRHAKSSWDEEGIDDFDRPLASRGIEAAPRIGQDMKREGWVPDAVLCSAALRAVETLDLITPALGIAGKASIERDLYTADDRDLLERLRALPDTAASVLLIGHNPASEMLARRLCGDGEDRAMERMQEKYPTGALAVITFAAAHWGELAEGGGYLKAFVRPKDV